MSKIKSAKHPGLNLVKLLRSSAEVETRSFGVVGARLGVGVGKGSVSCTTGFNVDFGALNFLDVDLSKVVVVGDTVVVLGTKEDFNSMFTTEDVVVGTVVGFTTKLTTLSSKFPTSLSLLLSVVISLAKTGLPC